MREYMREYRKREYVKQKELEYTETHKEQIANKNHLWYLKNKEKVVAYQKTYQKNRYATDDNYKTIQKLRKTITNAIKRTGNSKNKRVEDILGCSLEYFKEYISNQFQDGMSWDNWGEWHLDHIIPISNAHNEQEAYELNRFTNFQPLWAEDNLRKGDNNGNKGNSKNGNSS